MEYIKEEPLDSLYSNVNGSMPPSHVRKKKRLGGFLHDTLLETGGNGYIGAHQTDMLFDEFDDCVLDGPSPIAAGPSTTHKQPVNSDSEAHRLPYQPNSQACSMIHPAPKGILGQCFYTTGMIVSSEVCVEVTKMLFDTDIHLYIAGIDQKISAYVDNSYTGRHLLIGQQSLAQFSVQSNHCFGARQGQRWTIAQNMTGLRKRRVLLVEDPQQTPTKLQVFSHQEGLRRAETPGETATERKSREVLKRSETRHERLKKRHGARLAERYRNETEPIWDLL
ncbi:uncharacterized protein MYCGRDRAFT_90578 [Zymoseptoria tritici IPO323]|uniref:Uncharacterized protein n=1 Tax=Zymoseptoria tritici (strain CBS 115943 / IPO323) TaxID=336722 RepID=F9X2T0_ZYMTI|nr:uncharacterized protein MYCGRDRAFT_90578 [Zymoseptoria tritici IPO323]EGP90642.1 hypothetical protein MYCGRDRAFT_90578 [Zymoseptoria tritici IPO323]